MGRLRARPVRWVVTLLCGIWLMGLPRIQASSDGLVLLANNLARGIAHKWVMERCPIQEGMFMDLYPIVVAEKGKGAYEVRDYAVAVNKVAPPAPRGRGHGPDNHIKVVKYKDGMGHVRETQPEYFDDRKQWLRNNAKVNPPQAPPEALVLKTVLRGRRLLDGVDPYAPGAGEGIKVTTAELQRIAAERWQAKLKLQAEQEANVTIIEKWSEANDYREYFIAVKIIEDVCVNNTLYDRGPLILRDEMPEGRNRLPLWHNPWDGDRAVSMSTQYYGRYAYMVLFDFMLYLHASLGGCEPGHCSTVMSPPPPSPPPEPPLPPGSLGRTHTHPPRPPHPPVPCGEYLPQPCPVDMGVVTTSLLFGLVTGAAGMWYVLKAK